MAAPNAKPPWPHGLFELDHVFILTALGAPEAESLIRIGLREGSSNTHHGQGTSNRRFFFRNAMLELLWVDDPHEARKQPATRLRLAERWDGRERTASPFGVCIRPGPSGPRAAPFSHWLYKPSYSPTPISIATNSGDIAEPLLFFIPMHRRPDGVRPPAREPLDHPLGIEEVTGVRIHGHFRSPEAQSLMRTTAQVVFVPSDENLMEISFDGVRERRQADLRPVFPLVLHW